MIATLRLALAAAAVASPALAEPFALQCNGAWTTSSPRGDESGAYDQTFRIDPERGLWCGGPCERVSRIVDVLPDRYVLWATDEQNPALGRLTSRGEIDRTTGKLTTSNLNVRLSVRSTVAATCVRLAGTPPPFPTPQF